MILAGCDDDGSLDFPNWECNLRLALRLQNALAEDAPGLARPARFLCAALQRACDEGLAAH